MASDEQFPTPIVDDEKYAVMVLPDLRRQIAALRAENEALRERAERAEREATHYAAASRADFIQPDDFCERCFGSGYFTYASTAAWSGGIGGAAMTLAVCDRCWGSGDRHRPWPSHRLLCGADANRKAAAAAESYARRLREVLGEVEWKYVGSETDGEEIFACPLCEGIKGRDGHEPGCRIDAILNQKEGEA